MPRLSIILVARGSAEALEETLVSVLENRPDDCEVLVVHQGTYSDPYQLEGEVRFLEVPRESSRLRAVQVAAAACGGELLHFLASGTIVEPHWCEEALLFFADRRVASVVPLILSRRDRTRLLAAGVAYHRGGRRAHCGQGAAWREELATRLKPAGPTFSAGFYRRAPLEAAGGLSAEVGEDLADVDLALRLEELGYASVLASECRVYASSLAPAAPSGLQAGQHAERLFWRHAPRGGWPLDLFAHGVEVAAATLASGWRAPAHLLGRLLSLTNVPSLRRSLPQHAAAPARPLAAPPAPRGLRRIDASHADRKSTNPLQSDAASQDRRRAS